MFLPGGKSLPSPLQVKLGTKSMCIFYFWFYFTLIFVLFFFFFVCGRREGKGSMLSSGPKPPLSPLNSRQYRTGALLCFNLLLYSVVGVWRRSVSARTPQDPPWGCAALGQLGSLVTARIGLANHCSDGGGVIKNASYSGPENSSLLPERSHFFPVLFFFLLIQQTTRPSCCDRRHPCSTTPPFNDTLALCTLANMAQILPVEGGRHADISEGNLKIVR